MWRPDLSRGLAWASAASSTPSLGMAPLCTNPWVHSESAAVEEGCKAAPGESNELFINTAKEEAYHIWKKCLLIICPNGFYGTQRIAQGAELKAVTAVTAVAVRGSFQSLTSKARAGELSNPTAVPS